MERAKKIIVLKITVVSLLIAALIAIPVSAWLANNRQVKKSTGMQINGDLVAASKFEAYKFDDEAGMAKQVGVVYGSDDPVPDSLPLYDSIFIEKNENSSLIYRVPVFGTQIENHETFTITLDLQDKSDVTGLDDNNYLNGSKTGNSADAVADYVSNVIYVKCAVIQTLQDETIVPPDSTRVEDYIYNTAHNYFKSNTAMKKSFIPYTVTTTNGVETTSYDAKAGTLVFTVENYASLMKEDSTVLYVYLEIGYEKVLVDHMIETRGLSFSLDDNTIVIGSDLGDFVFSAATFD